MPHLLTDEQNIQQVKVAKKLLQMFQTYDKKQFANVVAGDENRVYYFELVRKVSNKILATKHSMRPIIVKRSLSARKVCLVFAIFCARLFICASWSPAGKGLTSWLSFVVSSVSLSLSHWYPGSGVVLDCIDS